MKQPTALEAKRYLSDVSPAWKSFWFHHGVVVKNLRQMSEALGKISQQAWEYHVNAKRNDVAQWVKDVVGDVEFAKNLQETKALKAMTALFEKRIAQFEKAMAVTASKSKKK